MAPKKVLPTALERFFKISISVPSLKNRYALNMNPGAMPSGT